MFEDWFKIRGFLGIFISLIIAIFSFAIFVIPANNHINSSYEKNSFVMNSELNYCFPEPSKNQIIELKNKITKENIFPYFLIQSDLNAKKKIVGVNVILAETFDNLDFTMYSPDRLITDSSISGNNISYIDYSLAKSADLKVGDEFTITIDNETINFIVAKIFEDNTAFPLKAPCVLIKYEGMQKELYNKEMSSVLGYSGVFVENTDVNLKDFINSYIPEGRLLPREEFSSNEKYKKYTDAIKNESYINEIMIYNKDSALQSYKKSQFDSIIRSIIGVIFIVLCIVLTDFVLANRKTETSYFRLVQNNKIVKKYRLYSITFDVTVGIIASFCLCFIFSFTVAPYLPGKYINFSLFLMIVAFIGGNFLSSIMTKGIYKRRESEIEKNQKLRNEIVEQLINLNSNFKTINFTPEIIESMNQVIKGKNIVPEDYEILKDDFISYKLSDSQVENLCDAIEEIRNTEKLLSGLKMKTKRRSWNLRLLICATAVKKDSSLELKDSLSKILDENSFSKDEKEIIFNGLLSS